jgi:hypothetical protein
MPLPTPGGGDEGRNGFGGPPGGGAAAGNELGIDLSGEIWVETPADGGEQNTCLNYLVLLNALSSAMKLNFNMIWGKKVSGS